MTHLTVVSTFIAFYSGIFFSLTFVLGSLLYIVLFGFIASCGAPFHLLSFPVSWIFLDRGAPRMLDHRDDFYFIFEGRW